MVYKNNNECIRCKNCGFWRDLSHFDKREDRDGYYAFCKDCMKVECRTIDYPSLNKRGGGNLELEPTG